MSYLPLLRPSPLSSNSSIKPTVTVQVATRPAPDAARRLRLLAELLLAKPPGTDK